MKDDLILFRIIHSRKLLNKLTMNFITVCFNFSILRYRGSVWL
jgi:hypothetical protein